MAHHEITVRHRSGMQPKRALINSVGGLHRPAGEKMVDIWRACRTLSKNPAVEAVYLTLVHETNVGVWRAGRKTK